MNWGAPTQVAHRRGSEWDSFVDTQSICTYSGYAAGLRQDLLRDSGTRQLCRRYQYTHELPSVAHVLAPPPWLFNLENIRITLLEFRVDLRLYPEGPHALTVSFLACWRCAILVRWLKIGVASRSCRSLHKVRCGLSPE